MTAAESPNTYSLVLTLGPEDNEAEVAYFLPLGLEETYEQVNRRVRPCEGATTEVLGQSAQGRNLWFVSVTDPSTSEALKHRVWVHSRAHPGEAPGTHVLLGFLGAFTEDSPLGRHLRRYCILNVVPLLNCDGVWLGHTRWDSQGIDPERQWCFPERIPEVAALRNRVDQLMSSTNPIELSLNFHSTQGTYTANYFLKHLPPSVTTEFEAIQQRYINAVAHATPLYVDHGSNTQLALLTNCPSIPADARAFIESYYWKYWGENVMALTHETFFTRRITDNEWLTSEDLQDLGRGMAAALIEYFNLPPLPPLPPPQEPLPSGWMMH